MEQSSRHFSASSAPSVLRDPLSCSTLISLLSLAVPAWQCLASLTSGFQFFLYFAENLMLTNFYSLTCWQTPPSFQQNNVLSVNTAHLSRGAVWVIDLKDICYISLLAFFLHILLFKSLKLLKNAQTIFPFNRENARMTFFESSSHVACEGEVHAAGEKPFKSYAF